MFEWFIANLNLHSPLLWILLSMLGSVTTSVLTWRYRPSWITWVWVGQWLLIPYLGLILGGLSPRLMGLSDIDWQATLGTGVGLIFAILALLVIVRISDASFGDAISAIPGSASGSPEETMPPTRYPKLQRITSAIVVSGAEQFHWVFLRGALWELLILAPLSIDAPSYWAIWIAGAIVLFESVLYRLSARQWLLQLVALTATSIVFLYTRNFWLCWMLHTAITLMLAPPRHNTVRLFAQTR